MAARVKPVISASLPGEFFAGEMAEVDGSVGNEGLETYKFGASLALRRVRSASRTHLSRFLCRKSLHRRALQPHFMLPNPEGVGYLHQKLRGPSRWVPQGGKWGNKCRGLPRLLQPRTHRSGFSGLWDWGVELTICSKSRPIIKRVCAPPGELLAAEMADADGDVGNQGLVKRVAFRSIGHIPSISSSERPHRRCHCNFHLSVP